MYIEEAKFPPEMTQFVRNHYVDVFGKEFAPIYNASLIDNLAARSFVAREDTLILGGFRILEKRWSAQILDFGVLPVARGKGVAKQLIDHAWNMVFYDDNMIFLDTRVYPKEYLYPDVKTFPSFLKNNGFEEYKAYPATFGEAEWLAYDFYKEKGDRPVAYRKMVRERDLLHHSVYMELEALTKKQRQVVLSGLDAKLGYFEHSGNLSYKYEVCPICNDIGSTIENPKCNKCYLQIGCKEPFHSEFRHDPQVGAMYFSQMRDCLRRM